MKTSNFLKSAILGVTLSMGATASYSANIVEIAATDVRFSTFVAAVQAVGLAETLSGPGPFIVFAFVNDAFAALPTGTVETLLMPENKDQLTNILLYHVDDRNLTAGKIPAGLNYFKPILASERTCIIKSGGSVTVADGSGQIADNGVILVIDKVLLPGTRPVCH